MWPNTFCLVSVDIRETSLRNRVSGVANLSQTWGCPRCGSTPYKSFAAQPSQGLMWMAALLHVMGILVSPTAASGGAGCLAGGAQGRLGACCGLCWKVQNCSTHGLQPHHSPAWRQGHLDTLCLLWETCA